MDPPQSLDSLTGRVLAEKYRLGPLLGAGGMGCVYAAEQLSLGRTVAVKLLYPGRFGQRGATVRAEALAASRVNHPHAVAIFDVDVTEDDVPYVVMEHLRGRTLAEVIETEPLRLQQVIRIGIQVLSALAEAHRCGVIHCDLTSDNVIVERGRSREDFAKVIDFGLSRGAEDGRSEGVTGTPEYMAPEAIRGEPLTPRTDLYAMGILLYEMIVGRTPFAGGSLAVVIDGHLHAAPPAPRENVPACPVELSDLVMWALAKDPERRPLDADAMAAVLLNLDDSSETRCVRCGGRRPEAARACPACGADGGQRPIAESRGFEPRGPRLRSMRLSTELERLGQRGHRGRFVGRENELQHVIDFCRGRKSSPALGIVGPRGAGKARLALEATGAIRRQVPVLIGGTDPSGARRPWFPVISLLERILDLGEDTSLATLARAVGRAGLPDRDVPGLAQVFGAGGPAEDLELAVRRREAEAAALRTLLSVHRRYPRVVLCFLDVHELDQPSRRLVAALVAAAPEHGVGVLLTAERSEDLPAGCRTLELAPLSREDSHELTECLVPAETPLPGQDEIHVLTGGAPAAVEQLAGWLETGASSAHAPSTLVDLVSARVGRLPGLVRRLLQATAVHGCAVPRWLVAATLDEPVIPPAADRACTGLLVVDQTLLTIPSELAAAIIYECTPADVRRQLHSRALAALENEGDPGVLGRHAEHAGDLMRAYRYYIAAGTDSLQRFDDVGAGNWYQRALSVARARYALGERAAGEQVVKAGLLLADVLRFTGHVGLAAGLLSESEMFGPSGRQRAELAAARGRNSLSSGDPELAVIQLHAAIGAAVRIGDRELICDTYIDLSRALSRAQREDDATVELAQAVDLLTLGQGLASAIGPPRLWYVGLLLAERYLFAGKAEQARAIGEGALELARRVDSARGRARLTALLAQICDSLGEPSSAMRHRASAIDEMQRLGDRQSTAELLIDNARLLRRSRDLQPIGAGHWGSTPDRGLGLAIRLASEVGWTRGVELSRELRRATTGS